jgi:6-phosphogluconolactonase
MTIVEHHHSSDAALADALAHDIAQRLNEAIAQRGHALLCVSGGKSPVPLFKALSGLPLAWAQVTVTLVDERCVPTEHPDSNAHLVRQHLLQGPAARARFVSWVPPTHTRVQAGTWMQEAQAYADWAREVEAQLRPLWPADVVVLGMGMDGHTASLFSQAQGAELAMDPQAPVLCAAVRPPHAPHDRLTLTLPALTSARHVALQISGPAKHQIYQVARQQASTGRPVSLLLSQPQVSQQPVAVWMGA